MLSFDRNCDKFDNDCIDFDVHFVDDCTNSDYLDVVVADDDGDDDAC